MMDTEILKIDASGAEKSTKMRVQFLLTPTVDMKLGGQHNYHKGPITNLPVPYDLCIGVPISHLLLIVD